MRHPSARQKLIELARTSTDAIGNVARGRRAVLLVAKGTRNSRRCAVVRALQTSTVMTKVLSPAELETITGGQRLNPAVPIHSRDRLLAQCGPQIDAYTNARQAYDTDKTNTRKEIDQVTAGRSLALCATNAGFDPPPSWRSGPQSK